MEVQLIGIQNNMEIEFVCGDSSDVDSILSYVSVLHRGQWIDAGT